eukprot:m.4863 g.4863  ORF g.4863 m.4863 type:complete len:155 (-) comp7242_c0_seq1:230-694(-)
MIRTAESSDTAAILARLGFGDEETNVLKASLTTFLDGADGHGWVVSVGNEPSEIQGAAYWPVLMTNATHNLLFIAVKPSVQGQGVGSAMMAHVEKKLSSAAQRLLIVETSDLPEMAATRSFYSKLGYTMSAAIPDFYDDNDGKVVFWKRLSPKA